MGRKHKHPEHENLERWVVSYADFMTLLFATFTALYAMAKAESAQHQAEILKEIQTGYRNSNAIQLEGAMAIIKGRSGSGNPENLPDIIDSPSKGSEGIMGQFKRLFPDPDEYETAKQAIEQALEAIKTLNAKIDKQNEDVKTQPPDIGEPNEGPVSIRPVEMTAQTRGIKVSFDSRFLFHSGSAALKPEAAKELSSVAKRLKELNKDHLIQVEGHTDDIPISTAVFPSNWELSTARASAVVRYLVDKEKFKPQNMSAVGYADSRPIASNKTKEGREKNRRIDIIVYSRMVSDRTNPSEDEKGKPIKTLKEPPKDPKIPPPKDPINLDSQLIETYSSGGDKGPIKIKYVQSNDPNALVPQVIEPPKPPDGAGKVVTPIEIVPDEPPPEPSEH